MLTRNCQIGHIAHDYTFSDAVYFHKTGLHILIIFTNTKPLNDLKSLKHEHLLYLVYTVSIHCIISTAQTE